MIQTIQTNEDTRKTIETLKKSMAFLEEHVKNTFKAMNVKLVEYDYISAGIMKLSFNVYIANFNGDIKALKNTQGVGDIKITQEYGGLGINAGFIYTIHG